MSGMNIVWLGVGVGLGWIASQLWQQRSRRNELATSPIAAIETDELPRLREQLRQTELAYYMAVEMSQFKGSFLARTSHELRSPMNGIIGMHQLILADLSDSPEEEREFIAQANESALKMVRVLDEVIDAAKVAQGTVHLQLQPIELGNLLQEVQRLTHLHAQNRNLRLTVTPPDTERYILADPPRLRQVLVSLIDAAIAQMHEGEIALKVLLSSDLEPEIIQLEVPVPGEKWLLDCTQLPTQIHNGVVQALDKAEIMKLASRTFPEPGFVFAVARSLMESMHGKLEVVATVDQAGITQIRCSIPRVPVEASVD